MFYHPHTMVNLIPYAEFHITSREHMTFGEAEYVEDRSASEIFFSSVCDRGQFFVTYFQTRL